MNSRMMLMMFRPRGTIVPGRKWGGQVVFCRVTIPSERKTTFGQQHFRVLEDFLVHKLVGCVCVRIH